MGEGQRTALVLGRGDNFRRESLRGHGAVKFNLTPLSKGGREDRES